MQVCSHNTTTAAFSDVDGGRGEEEGEFLQQGENEEGVQKGEVLPILCRALDTLVDRWLIMSTRNSLREHKPNSAVLYCTATVQYTKKKIKLN